MPEDVALNPDASPASAGTSNLTESLIPGYLYSGAAPATAGNEPPAAAATAVADNPADNGDGSQFDYDSAEIQALLAELESSQAPGHAQSPLLQQDTPEERGPVPYDRFREVNEKAKRADASDARLGAWADVIADLEGQGFKNAADVRAAMERQAQAQREAQVQAQYDEWAEQELIDPDVAKAQAQAEIMRIRYEESMRQVTDYMTAQKKQDALKQYPEAVRGSKMVDRMVAAGVDPATACQIVAEQVREISLAEKAGVAARMQAARKAPAPSSSANTTRPVAGPQNGNGLPMRAPGLASLLGIRGNPNGV